jgi:hypothetical protein
MSAVFLSMTDFLEGRAILPSQSTGDFLAWLGGVPDWPLFTLQTVDAYFYSLILMLLIWAIMRLAKRKTRNTGLSLPT